MGYAGAAVALRATYYTGSLGGAGLAFFALLFGARQEMADAEAKLADARKQLVVPPAPEPPTPEPPAQQPPAPEPPAEGPPKQ